MRKTRRHKKPVKPTIEAYRKNDEIISPLLFVIDENSTPLGELSLEKALAIAAERELDLVEVSPKANPPVAKFVNYGKFQYQQEKLARKQKTKSKQADIKGIRLTFRIGQHDLELRQNQAKKFIDDGHKVRLEMNLRGREKQYSEKAKATFDSFVTAIGAICKVELPFSRQDGKLSMLLAPKK